MPLNYESSRDLISVVARRLEGACCAFSQKARDATHQPHQHYLSEPRTKDISFRKHTSSSVNKNSTDASAESCQVWFQNGRIFRGHAWRYIRVELGGDVEFWSRHPK